MTLASDSGDLGNSISEAIASGDETLLRKCAYEIEERQLGRRRFSQSNLNVLLGILEDPAFLSMSGAWKLLMSLEFDVVKLSARQRAAVVNALGRAYPHFGDPTSCFFVTELLGTEFCGRSVLRLFEGLLTRVDGFRRALLPHGFEHLAQCNDVGVARKAFGRLVALASDPAEDVRCEALLSLERLIREETPFRRDACNLIKVAQNDQSESVRALAAALRESIEAREKVD